MFLANNLFLMGRVCFRLLEFPPDISLAAGLTAAGDVAEKTKQEMRLHFLRCKTLSILMVLIPHFRDK